MIATPFAVVSHEPVESPKKRQRKAWAPDGKDELVYQWVMFEGKSQDWVASALGISQSTVSRILQRYEKWQAHAEPGASGSLTRDEDLRVQRWLTYQRNEVILASCLRIASEVERPMDGSKSVAYHNRTKPSQPTSVSTEWTRPERCGMAARFLRLAFKINMEQLKLKEREPLPQLPPLSEEDLAEQIAVTEDAREEKEEASRTIDEKEAFEERVQIEVEQRVAAALAKMQREAEEFARQLREGESAGEGEGQTTGANTDPQSTADAADEVIRDSAEPAVVELKVHNLHNCIPAESSASSEPAESCERFPPAEKMVRDACTAADAAEPTRAT